MALESFMGLDGGEGMDEAAFEAFKEKMRAAAAQIAAIKKEEKKARKKEDELLKILLYFVKHSHKTGLVLLITRALEQNIPANFILSIVLLGNEDIQKAVGNFLLLKEGDGPQAQEGRDALPEGESANDKALIFFKDDETLPLKVKIELDAWMKAMLLQAEETPHKLLKTAFELEFIEKEEDDFGERQYERVESIKVVLVQLVAHILRDYLESKEISVDQKKVLNFAEFILKGILDKTKEGLDNRQLLDN